MKSHLIPVAAVLLVCGRAFAQDSQDLNSVDTSHLKMGVGTTAPAVPSVSSTKGDAKDEAQADLDDKGDVVLYYKGDKKKSLALSADQKQEIFEALSQLMDEAEAKKRTVTKDIALKHKFAGIFGQNIHAHLCATTAEIHNSYPNEVCGGNLLRVSWANTQTAQTATQTPAEAAKPIPGHYTSDMFPPNDSAIVAGSAYADALDQQIAEVVAEVKDKGAALTGINIFSSASTLRNTGGAKDETHLQLSRDRAEKAFAYVSQKLAEQGIPVDSSLTPDKPGADADSEGNDVATLDFGGGETCNGTTGENPPANYKWTSDLDKTAPGTPAAAMDSQGKAAVAARYNKYQYVDVSFETVSKAEPSESVETTKAEQDYYASVGVAGEYREKGPPFRPLGFLRRIHGASHPHKSWGSTACPTF